MATYVVSPSTQSGVSDTRTHITRSFTLFAGGSVQVDYTVSSEADWDFLRIYVGGATTFAASGEASGTATINTPSGGARDIRIEYEKDGGVDEGTDNCRVDEIRIYNSSAVLQETHNFSGTAGNTPTGWTENLVDGGNDVVGSHWALVDTGGGGTTLTPSLFTNAQTFYGPAASHGVVAGLFTSSATFFAPTVADEGATGDTLEPSLFTNAQTFYGPTLTQGLAPSLFTASQTFHAPALTLGLSASLLSGGQVFYDATVTDLGPDPGDVLSPSLFTNSQTFYAPSISLALSTAWWGNTSVFFAPEVRVAALPPSAHGVELRNGGPSRAELEAKDFRARIQTQRPCTAKVRADSYTAELSEG